MGKLDSKKKELQINVTPFLSRIGPWCKILMLLNSLNINGATNFKILGSAHL
jgi:hypothetical protein